MKKFIQNLFKNKIFKKITMSVLFVAMCFVACFMNWKAIAGDATHIGGGNSKIMTFTWDPNNDSIRSISFLFEHAEDGITINRNISDNTNATWSDGAISVDYNNQEYIWVYVITDNSKNQVNIDHNDTLLGTEQTGVTSTLYFKQSGYTGFTFYDYDPGTYNILCGNFVEFKYEKSNVNVADLMDIEYSTASDNGTFSSFQSIPKDENGHYKKTYFPKINATINLKVAAKSNFDIQGLQYSHQTSNNLTSNYYEWGNTDTRTYQITGTNTFTFRGVTTPFNIEEQNAEINSSLFNKLDIKYSYDSNNPNDSFPNNGALTPEVGKKMHISISPKTGYDISGLNYSTDGGTTYKYWNSSDNPFTNGSGFDILKPTTLKIKNVKYKQVNLHFVDENNQALDSDLVKITYNGSTLSDNEPVVNGISTTEFTVELGVACSNYKFTLSDNFKWDSNKGITLSDKGDSSARSLNLKLKVESNESDIYVKIINLEWKTAKFTFTRDDREVLYLTKNVGDTHYSEYTPWDQNNCLTVNDACRYKSNITFYLNAADLAHWNSEKYGINDLITVKNYDTSEVMQISAFYQIDIDAYAITFTNVMRDVDVTLKPDVVSISNINIKFSGINLPEDRENHNGINITQGGVNATYPERISSEPYTFVAKLTPKHPGESITVQLSNTDNFDFTTAIYVFDFYDSNNRNLGSISINPGEIINNTISFKIPDGDNGSENILDHLGQGDLNVVCNCLKPKDKSLYFVLDSGISGIQVKDDRGNQITQREGNNAPYDAYYGAFITVTAKLNNGYFMEIPEDCVHIHKYNTPNAEITNWIITQDGDKDSSIYKIEFFDLLTDDIEIVFTCDQNSIPINFKNFEGADYYAVNATHNGTDEPMNFELSDAIKGIITVKSGDDCYFAVGAQAGYDLNGLNITRNGVGINSSGSINNGEYKVYKLENVDTNITVNGSVPKRILRVNFDPAASVEGGEQNETARVTYKRDNYAINGGVDVTYGNAVTFTVSLDDKYSQSNFKVLVKNENEANGREVTKYQNEYRITDITANQTVSVEGVTVNKYTLNFVPSSQAEFLVDGASFTGVKNANYDSSFEFKVRAKTGYKLGENLVVNCQKDSGDTELEKIKDSSDNGSDIYRFKIEHIKENYTLVIDKVENITYKITLQHVEGATYLNDQNSVVSGDMKVNYGKNFEFSVTLADAYDDSAAGMYIIINDGKSKLSAQKLSSGRYMIPNITEDITIKVGNVRKNTYTITLQDEDGIDYYNAENKLITGDNTVEHKGSLSFRVNVYPSYSDSSITVMLGNDKMAPDSSGYYHISGVIENKTVTVIGLHPNSEVGLVNAINNLPSPVNDLNDVDEIIEASKWYNSLNDAQKANITNADVLMKHQEEAGAVLHRSNDVTIDGPDWYIKLIVNPISSDMDACARIYKKLNSEYVLSLYDIYLWDTLNDVRYTPSGDQMYTITVPTPRLINFKNPTGVHENSNSGKISFMDLNFNGDTVSFETNSFSAMGIIAELDASGASSLFDAAGVNLDWVNDYVLGDAKSNSSNKNMSSGTITRNADASEDYTDGDQIVGNINDKFRSTNNRVTAQGSALRLILVLLVLILLALAIWVIYKKRKEEKEE